MVKVVYGRKGSGKTKILIDAANGAVYDGKGDVVFIGSSNELIYSLKHEVRFINLSDYPISNPVEFLGFVCGVIAEDYDIEAIVMDQLSFFSREDVEYWEKFFDNLKEISRKFNIKFYIGLSDDNEQVPEFMREYID